MTAAILLVREERKMPVTDTSVMVALSELGRMESERVAREIAQENERRQKEAERLRREQEERAETERHRLRVAEAEARLRVAEELRTAEAVSRANRIEEELRNVKAEKAVMAEHLFALPAQAAMPDGYRFWRFVSAALFVVATLAVVAIFAWPPKPPPPPPVIITERVPTPPSQETAALKSQIDELEARWHKAMRDAAALQKAAAVRPKPSPTVKPTPKPVDLTPERIKACEEDPLLCFNLKK
jgi:hypothetical protein